MEHNKQREMITDILDTMYLDRLKMWTRQAEKANMIEKTNKKSREEIKQSLLTLPNNRIMDLMGLNDE